MKLLIVVHHRLDLWNVPPWVGERLRAEFPQVQVVLRDTYEGIDPDLRNAEIIFTISLRPEQFAVTRNLRWIHAPSAAVHQLLSAELVNSDVVLTNSREVHGPVVAEHVMGLIFALAKKIPQAVRFQQQHVWGQEQIWNEGVHPREIAGATLGLIGVGSIGCRVAKMASSLGMRVIAVREHVDKPRPEGIEAVFATSQLDDLLRQSDYVVMAAP
jgi:phosphoglycerate dehydrogenase-like enzyme